MVAWSHTSSAELEVFFWNQAGVAARNYAAASADRDYEHGRPLTTARGKWRVLQTMAGFGSGFFPSSSNDGGAA